MIPLGILSECRTYIKFGIEKKGLQQDLGEDLKNIEDLINTERVVERCKILFDHQMGLNSIEKLSVYCFKNEKIADQKVNLLILNGKLQDAYDYSKRFPNFIHWQAKILHYLERTQEAIDLLRDKPDYKEVLEQIQKSKSQKDQGTGLYKEQKYNDALNQFNQCLLLDHLNVSYNSTIQYNIGMCQIKLNNSQEALNSFNQCLVQNPDHQKCLFQRAELYKQLGYFQEAITDYQRVTILDVKFQILEAQRKLLEAVKTKCHYKVLGLPTDASSEDIKKAYRVMARQWHPDHHQTSSEEQKRQADIKFKEINEAY